MVVMRVSVFTPSTGRPEMLALCRKRIEEQDYPILEHIVQEGGTLVENLISGLPKTSGDIVVIAEDDDYYSPDWVTECVNGLNLGAVAFGDIHSHYYHLGLGRRKVFRHPGRSSLNSTAFRRELIPTLVEACTSEKSIDIRFWRALNDGHVPRAFRDSPNPLVIGLKGGPGLRGMGIGHLQRTYLNYDCDTDDENCTLLRSLLGGAADEYISLVAASSGAQRPHQSGA